MIVTLSALTETAQDKFSDFLDRIRSGSEEDPPHHLLEGEENVIPIELSNGFPELDGSTTIETRMDIGRYLSGLIPTRQDLALVVDNKEAGSFLALLFFDNICRRRDDRTWAVRANDRYIPNLPDRRRFYRHQVFSPLSVYKLHGEMGRLFLCQKAYHHPDTMEQISGREEMMLIPAIVELADRLYWDVDSGGVKVGATSYDPVPDGAMRRFVGPGSFTEQYGVVYDFWTMDVDSVAALLPIPEFSGWLG